MDELTPNGYAVDTREHRTAFYHSHEWLSVRRQALERDHYECIWCADSGVVTSGDVVLEVDHIHELEYYPREALDLDNLRTLCKDCHNKRHKRFGYAKREKKPRKYSSATYDEWW